MSSNNSLENEAMKQTIHFQISFAFFFFLLAY